MSKISYDALAIDGLKDVFAELSASCKELGIDFFIVGAIARNIWYINNDKEPSGTKDIDFGIFVANVEMYNQLKKSLIEKYGYIASAENSFRLITSDDKPIDLLPFGAMEQSDQSIINGVSLMSLNLEGFKEVYQLGIVETVIGNEKYKSCSIPGVVILKLIAFDDRPDRRLKDVADINAICINYPSIESELIWNGYFDLYDKGLDHQEVGVRVLGCEMKKVVNKNVKLEERLLRIIDQAINEETSFLINMIDDPMTETLNDKKVILNNLKIGFSSIRQ